MEAHLIEEMYYLQGLKHLAEKEAGLQKLKAKRILRQVKHKQMLEAIRDTFKKRPDLYYATELASVEEMTQREAHQSLVFVNWPEKEQEVMGYFDLPSKTPRGLKE